MKNQVMFYPGAGTDHGPLAFFAKEFEFDRFVFADYGLTRDEVIGFISDIPGWSLVPDSVRDLAPGDFDAQTWADFWHPDCDVNRHDQPFAFECQLRDRGGRVVLLRYLGVDAFGCYRALLKSKGWQPAAVSLQDHGFGGNWSMFGGDSPMFHSASAARLLPDTLLVAANTDPWPGYMPSGQEAKSPGQAHGHRRFVYRRCP